MVRDLGGFFWDLVNDALESCGNNNIGVEFSESHFPEEPSFSTCQTNNNYCRVSHYFWMTCDQPSETASPGADSLSAV